MTKPADPMTLHDYIHELTDVHTHREHYVTRRGATWYGNDHVTRVPPLLVQLQYAQRSTTGEAATSTGYQSRPAAALESLDVLRSIDQSAAEWVRRLGDDDPGSTVGCVKRVGGLEPSTDPRARRDILHDVRQWWTQARVTTGWDSPPWRPDNTCPACGERGALRVNLQIQGGMCVGCRATWDRETIGILADHIRVESARSRVPPTPRDPCVCPVSFLPDGGGLVRPVVSSLTLCPACGSSRCVHALEGGSRGRRVLVDVAS